MTFPLEVIQAAINNQSGFCIDCGSEHSNCEPDARERECETCGKRSIYGAEEMSQSWA